MEICRTTALPNPRYCRIRPGFLFGLGTHLATNGLLLLALYYAAAYLGNGRELLAWVVPTAQISCFLAAVSLAAGLMRRELPETDPRPDKNWSFRSLSFELESHKQRGPGKPKPVRSSNDMQTTLTLLKSLDWKGLRDVGISYFAEIGFRIIDQPERSQGVDFYLCTPGDYNAIAVHCLPQAAGPVDLQQVQNCHRAGLLAGAVKGVIVAAGVFDDESVAFAEEHALELITGEHLAARLLALPKEGAERVLAVAANAENRRPREK